MSKPGMNDPEGPTLKDQTMYEELTPADLEAMEEAEMRGEVFARVIPARTGQPHWSFPFGRL